MEIPPPLVSIICPVFNKERYLSKTIASVLDQTVSFWELILVDDGSTDESLVISLKAEKKCERIRVIQRDSVKPTKRGANVCRNIGLDASQGKYIIFLDADDVLLPFCLERRLEAAKKNPGCGLYIFNVAYTMDLNGNPFAKLQPSQQVLKGIKREKDLNKYFLKKFISFDLPWHTSGPLWEKEILTEMNGFDENFQRLQDPEIHTRVLLSKKAKLSYHMADYPYDVLHLKDENRTVWHSSIFYDKQINAIGEYLSKFVPLIADAVGSSYLKYLQGYLIFAETLTYRYLRENQVDSCLKREILKQKNTLYQQNSIKKVVTVKFKAWLVLYHWFAKSALLSKLRIPGAILLLMKKTI